MSTELIISYNKYVQEDGQIINKRTKTSLINLLPVIILVIGYLTPAYAAYQLVWSDEFNGSSLNTSNWTPDIGDGCPEFCPW